MQDFLNIKKHIWDFSALHVYETASFYLVWLAVSGVEMKFRKTLCIVTKDDEQREETTEAM